MSKHVVIIAEAGVNHNGSLDNAKKLIDVAAEAKADFVKFQTFNTSDLVTEDASMAEYQSKNTGKMQTQFEMLKKLELTTRDHDELIAYCEKRKIGFLSTPFGIREADFLEDLVPFFKVPSGELTNHPFLRHLAQKGKAIVMSTGMATLKEVEESVEVILREWRSCGKPELAETTGLSNPLTLLHCTTSYPTPYDQVNLKAITTMEETFPALGIGFSDHSLGTEVPVSSVALGVSVIEKHFTLDRTMEGPDHAASLEPRELIEMVKGIRIISSALGTGEKLPQKSEVMNKEVARKSLFFSRDLKEGEIPAQSDFTIKRPGDGLEPSMIPQLVTKSLCRDVSEGKIVKIEDFK